MNSNAQVPAGFTAVDQKEMLEVEGGLSLSDILFGAAAVALGTGNVGGGVALGVVGSIFKFLGV